MEELTIENNMQQNLGNKLGEWQHTFLESTLGKTINAGVDIGLKAVLPDLIEDEVIDVKNTILEQGFSEGIKEIVQTGINMGKSMLGIVTGNFENISQIQMAVKNGGILDKVSELLDFSIHLAKNKNLINNQIASLLKQGKNSIIHSVSDKIEETLTN